MYRGMTMSPGLLRRGGLGRGIAIVAALLVALLLSVAAQAAPTFPKLTGRVVDDAHILPAETVAALDQKLAALEQSTGGTQLVVATVPDLQGYEIEEYGYQLGRAWGIGQAKANTGAILIVAPKERKVRIEVGYGLEGQLTDALSSLIIQNDIVPRFKAGDMPGGIVAGADALIAQLQLPPDQARQVVAKAAQAHSHHKSGGIGLGSFAWVIIVVLWLFFSMFRGRRGMGIGQAIVWSTLLNSGRDRDGWGGGGGGGGGFGGGGGSFGGGGASGGW